MNGDNVPSIEEALAPDAGAAEAGAGGGGTPGTPTVVQDFSLDTTRKRIAFFLLYIMAGVIALVALVSLIYSADCWLNGSKCTQAEGALNLLNSGIAPMFTAMIGLVGSVVGFYFGSKSTS